MKYLVLVGSTSEMMIIYENFVVRKRREIPEARLMCLFEGPAGILMGTRRIAECSYSNVFPSLDCRVC